MPSPTYNIWMVNILPFDRTRKILSSLGLSPINTEHTARFDRNTGDVMAMESNMSLIVSNVKKRSLLYKYMIIKPGQIVDMNNKK